MDTFLSPKNKLKTRDKVLKSALILFVEKGFFNTSISDLVKHSGVSSGSIYHSFKDKQALSEALIQELIVFIEEQQQTILKQHSHSWDRFYQLCKWKLETAEENPHMMQFILKAQHQEFMPNYPPICSSKPFLTLRDIIRQGMENQEVKEMDVMIATSITFGGVLRLIQLRLDGLLEKPLPSYLDEITKTSWQAIQAPE